MTKINRIMIHGFKSFAHKTDVPFADEFNCILGPNGSGKSNIGDALCFVLGRLSAKSMRAEKAANLIFNGGKNKKPAQAGSVEIEFCNKNKVFPMEEDAVTINRTIKKSGSSVYRVNDKKKTRTEIVDLLSIARVNPDGYNIILQGDITKFVTMSPLERRRVIEEISDVSIYEDKKHKAMLELNKVEDKLNSATIILKERGTYLKELKKDRDQALKFKELKDKIDANKATFLSMQIAEKKAEHDKIQSQVGGHQEKISVAQNKIDKLKAQMVEHKTKINEINSEIERKGEKEQVKVHKELEDLKVDIAKDKTRVSVLKDEINKIKVRKDQFKNEIKDLQEKNSNHAKEQKELKIDIIRKQRELAEVEKSIEQFKKKHKIETSGELDGEIDDKDKLIEQKQEEIQQIRVKQQELLREKDKIEYQLESIDEKVKKVREVEKENKDQVKQLQKLKEDFRAATLRLNKCLDQDSSFASQMANARKNSQILQEKHADLNAKSLSVKAGLAANQAVKAIIEKRMKGVHGTVAELGQVKKKYAMALEMSAGARLQNIVVENDSIAADCIKYLKSNKLGSASFIPLNKIKYQEIRGDHKKLAAQSGVHDFALNLITFKPRFEKAFNYVFGTTMIVDDIATARKVGIGTVKMTTLDGNIVESSGVMKGGFIRRKTALGFKEQDSLEALERVEGEIAQLEGVLANVSGLREKNIAEIDGLRISKAEWEGQIITLEKTLHLGSDDLDATNNLKKELIVRNKEIDSEISDVQRLVSAINKELAALKSNKAMLRSKVNELRNPRLLAQLSAFEESRQKNKLTIARLEGDLKNSTSNMEQLYGPELIKIQEIITQHNKEEEQFIQEIKDRGANVSKMEDELALKEKASKEFYSKYRALFSKREELSGLVNKSDSEMENMREKIRGSEREVNLVSLKNAEVKARLAGLEEEFIKYKDVKLFKDKPVEELRNEITKFEVMLGQMSAVNMKALEVYEQVNIEFEKLIEKKQSLTGEKTDVLTLMNEIETKKKEHFMKTFKHANENFKSIFTNLFKKGKAYLELENPTKPFEDGLSIKVKMSGNRFMDIKSLSGGEKTLTALSFIFAIQEYQPASFYILDEIDAALDKHNAEKLAQLIRSYSDRAQYIVISHNDSLISEADTLFGISMTDGISKITSLKI
jgi:chromosome segregation protein